MVYRYDGARLGTFLHSLAMRLNRGSVQLLRFLTPA